MIDIDAETIKYLIIGVRYIKTKDLYSYTKLVKDENDKYIHVVKKYRFTHVVHEDRYYPRDTYYFVNIADETDVKYIKAINGVPTYDGFNNKRVCRKRRKIAYQHKYYSEVTFHKRRKKSAETKEERDKVRKKKEEERKKIREAKEKKKEEEKKKKLTPRFCLICGKLFTPVQSVQKFCSKECYRKRATTENNFKVLLNNIEKKTCLYCGITFETRSKELYCSPLCKQKAKEENNKKENNN